MSRPNSSRCGTVSTASSTRSVRSLLSESLAMLVLYIALGRSTQGLRSPDPSRPTTASVAVMYVETVVQINDRDTYQATVRLRSSAASSRPPLDAFVRFSPAGWLTLKPLTGGQVTVVSAAEVIDVSAIERVQVGGE